MEENEPNSQQVLAFIVILPATDNFKHARDGFHVINNLLLVCTLERDGVHAWMILMMKDKKAKSMGQELTCKILIKSMRDKNKIFTKIWDSK